MDAPRTLVVFYSRSGATRRAAQALSGLLMCDLEEITEPKGRAGVFGYLRSLIEATRKRRPAVSPGARDVSSYDLVIVGTPVWGWSVSSPIRAYLAATANRLPEVAFFCTLGASGSERAFAQMEAIVGKKPRAVCAITERDMAAGRLLDRLSAFEKALKIKRPG